MIVEVQGIVKKYPSFELADISFGLEGGRIAGFIGRNGAGKTTTIKAMLNLIHPDSGLVQFFGCPIAGNETGIKKRIGYSTGTVSWYYRQCSGRLVTGLDRLCGGLFGWSDRGRPQRHLQHRHTGSHDPLSDGGRLPVRDLSVEQEEGRRKHCDPEGSQRRVNDLKSVLLRTLFS